MCTLSLSAYKRGCKGVGGIEKIWLIDKSARIAASVTYAVASGALTITGTGAAAFEIEPDQNSWSFTQPATDDNNAGTTYVTQTLAGNLRGYSAALVDLSDSIRKGRLEALILDKNGVYIMAGIEANGLQSGGGDLGNTGAAIGDTYGFSFSLTCESTTSAPTLADFTTFESAFTIEKA